MLNEEQRREIAAYINAAPDRIERARRKRDWYAQLNMAGPDALRRAAETAPLPLSNEAIEALKRGEL